MRGVCREWADFGDSASRTGQGVAGRVVLVYAAQGIGRLCEQSADANAPE